MSTELAGLINNTYDGGVTALQQVERSRKYWGRDQNPTLCQYGVMHICRRNIATARSVVAHRKKGELCFSAAMGVGSGDQYKQS
jgi:hypothetical protein